MSDAPIRVAIHGAGGRMGRELIRAAADLPGLTLTQLVDHVGHPGQGQPWPSPSDPLSLGEAVDFEACDVVVDFSLPGPAGALYLAAAAARCPVVTGTTGLEADHAASLTRLSEVAPIVAAPNFSQGVTLLNELVRLAAEKAGPSFDAEIVELHHRRKVDAPSGTAVRLAQIVTEAKSIETTLHGRSGQVGARTDGEVAVLAVRGGDVVGEHTVYLFGEGERLELTHRATDRGIFARGALRAAAWVVGREPGRYDMMDVMGLR